MKVVQNLRDCADVSLVGGKAANLGALMRAGFAVPDGFVITTAADDDSVGMICAAYRELGAPAVAVRSSATVEDHAEASMAGQFSTVLNVRTEAELLDAIRVCRGSAQTPRARAYLSVQSRSPGPIAMAVVVQRQIASGVAGVLFTSDPHRPDEMLIEAARGLGEAVVSGRVQPDTFRLQAKSGRLTESRAAGKEPCLTEAEVTKLWTLGRDVAAHSGSPQDLEWAISDGQLFLLQARPITTSNRAAVRAALIEATQKRLAQPGCGPWVIHNLAETLPHPTPLTWSVLRRFMSGSGGFGAMYQRLGFEPAAGEFLELILGKVYMDLTRAPELFGESFPFAYDSEILRRDASAAQLPPSVPRGSWLERFRAGRQMREAQRRIGIESCDFDCRLSEKIIPEFVAWCAQEKRRDLSALSTDEWIALWRERERRVLDEFAAEIFFTNFIAASALARLREFLAEHFWNDDPDAFAQLLASAGPPNRTLVADAELREVAQESRALEAWLADHGHRAVGEFDLAAPRWREISEELATYAARLKTGRDPLDLHRERAEQAAARIAGLPPQVAEELRERCDLARRYLTFREDGKHHLMLGYDLLRDMALDASRRLDTDVFWLTFDELEAALRDGSVMQTEIDQRKREHRAEARLTLPQFIDASSLGSLGEAPKLDNADRLDGLAISSGFASGPVRIVESPLEAQNLGTGYVLVCPSTDPEWTPLFVNAAALVLECGGTLSHGAIVAREMNIPAVVLPNATRLLHEGEQLFVDGSQGIVARNADAKPDASKTSIAREKIPPVAGSRERQGARLRNLGFALWGVYLLAVWVLPESWLYQPSLHLLDRVLWPLVPAFGKPAAVAIIGASLAVIAALTQAFFTDNLRLREALRRVRALREETGTLASARNREVASFTSAVQRRAFGASLVPIGLLLGVFVMSFAWVAARMDQTNPPPGSAARVIATIDADFREPVTLSIDPSLRLDETSAPTRSLPPIRETLERLPSEQGMPESAVADLRNYLREGVPPQTLTWLVRSDTAGLFPVTLTLGKTPPVRQFVVFGDKLPPPDGQTIRHHPLQSVKVEIVGPKSAFWIPTTTIQKLNRDVGWPWAYLAGYLPTWLFLRRLLRLT